MFKKTVLILLTFAIVSCSTKEKETLQSKRIISLAPNITEILFALNLGERVIGVTEYCTYPAEALSKQNVGALFNPNLEKIAALKPDLIFATESNIQLNAKLDNKRIKVVLLPERTVEDVYLAIDSIGVLTGKKQQAGTLIASIKDSLALYKGAATTQKPSAILVLGRDENSTRNIGISGPGAFINELWEFAGGVNAFPDMPGSFTQVNREDLLFRDPQIIIEFKNSETRADSSEKQLKNEWLDLNISAVKNGNIFVISGVSYLVPGPRIYLLLKEYEKILRLYHRDH